MTPSGRFPRFRAPQGDGEVLCVPSECDLPAFLEQNRHRRELANVEWHGQSLTEIAREARREIVAAAMKYTSAYADVGDAHDPDGPLVFTGHQPEIFHPGVWLKNFVSHRLAVNCGGTAINLIIDSDLCRRPIIRVPSGTTDQLQFEMVALDRADREVPFEERTIADESLWTSFGERVTRLIAPLGPEPMIEDWWPTVVRASKGNDNLGRSIAQARHQWELRWGARLLDLPQSYVCRSRAFRLFATELLLRAAEFRDAYNAALVDYRLAHHIKNHAQPMPNLAEVDGWLETPFWLWSSSNGSQRRGLFVRKSGQELELSDRHEFTTRLSADANSAVEQLGRLEAEGIKIRTRALATTLFARLLLADLFIHGIGGAKYDQVSDEICASFFGVPLQAYATISGTLRLPIAVPAETSRAVNKLRQELREHRFHPEKHRSKMAAPLDGIGQIDELIASKQQWIDSPKTHKNAGKRHRAITETNRKLQGFLAHHRIVVESELAAARIAASTEQLRNSREHAYCLFPERMLRNFFGV
jgi:hypothetical protein